MKQQFHRSRVQMGALTSVGLLASAAIAEHIHDPKLRMLGLAGMAALVSIFREMAYHHQHESFAESVEHSRPGRSR